MKKLYSLYDHVLLTDLHSYSLLNILLTDLDIVTVYPKQDRQTDLHMVTVYPHLLLTDLYKESVYLKFY